MTLTKRKNGSTLGNFALYPIKVVRRPRIDTGRVLASTANSPAHHAAQNGLVVLYTD